jgi:protein SCO1/2
VNYRPVSVGIASAALLALVGGVVLVQSGPSGDDIFAPCRAGVVGGGAIGGPFTLVDENGAVVTEKDVITGPTLIYFGYTFCPDVCPLDNIRNAEAVDLLEAEGIEIKPVFISFDPQRDTPDVLRDFTDAMHPRMLGLTGSEQQVKAASQAYKTYFKRQEDGGEYYLIDHSTFSYFMMPEHGFVEFFNRDASAQDVAKSMACFVNAAS